MLTKGAIGNLVNRYKAVLRNCNLINTFGSLAVASMLVLGGAGVAGAAEIAGVSNQEKVWGSQSAYLTSGENTISSTEFAGNEVTVAPSSTANTGGGAVYSSATLTITNTTFSKNIAKYDTDGGVYSRMTGGAIFANGGSLTINDSTFTENESNNGGALTAHGVSSISIKNTTFSGNMGGNGGAIYLRNSGNTEFENCTFSGNISEGRGGAIQASYGSTLTLKGKNVFENNEGGNGGAISVHYKAGDRGATNGITFAEGSETIFKNNTAAKSGGAIHCDNDLTFGAGSTVTFENNHAVINGGAIANSTDDMVGVSTSSSASKIAPTTTFEGTVKFINNTSEGEGGAIYNPTDGTVALNGDATFENNSDANGKNDIQNDGTLEIGGTTTIDGGIAGEGTIEGTSDEATIVFTSVDSKVEGQTVEGTVKAKASAELNDALGGDVEAFKKQFDGVELAFAGMEEGLVAGAVDASGKMAKNSIMDAALKQASVTTVALDKILTNDVRKRLGDIRSDKNTTGVWMRWDGGKLQGNGLSNEFNTIQIGGDTKV
ncbi:MAG: hypothetical protein IKY97_02700, partial [Mailhella sp.]|nr:hypothetical protein [Mailhella sp.]